MMTPQLLRPSTSLAGLPLAVVLSDDRQVEQGVRAAVCPFRLPRHGHTNK